MINWDDIGYFLATARNGPIPSSRSDGRSGPFLKGHAGSKRLHRRSPTMITDGAADKDSLPALVPGSAIRHTMATDPGRNAQDQARATFHGIHRQRLAGYAHLLAGLIHISRGHRAVHTVSHGHVHAAIALTRICCAGSSRAASPSGTPLRRSIAAAG